MHNGFKERAVSEIFVILVVLFLLCLITRLWPLVFLAILALIAAALRMLFVSTKRKSAGENPPAPTPPAPPRLDNEQDVIRIAYGILERRVTEQVASRYPAARWVWEPPNAMERFATGLHLTILLSQAGGFGKAAVQISSLQFCGLSYESAMSEANEAQNPGVEPEPGPEPGDELEPDPGVNPECDDEADEAVDYTFIAFQWVEANVLELNHRCNDVIAVGETTLLIPATELPHQDSWADICSELTRNGFDKADVQEDGISVTVPK
jgi:hypothetical protein